MTHRSRRLGLALLVLAATMPMVSAAPYTWTTSGSGSVLTDGPGTWNTSALNWTTTGAGDAVPWPNLTTDSAVFGVNSGAAGTVTVGAVSTNGIAFNAAGSGSYLLSGGTIALGGSFPTITTGSGVSATIASSVTSASTLSTGGGGTLTMSGSFTLTSTGSFTVGHGEFVLASGAVASSSRALTVGTNVVGGTGMFRIQSGGSLAMTASTTVIGSDALPRAAVVQEGGSVSLTASSLTLSTNGGATTYSGSASYTMQGGSLALNSTSTGFMSVGRNAPATFTQSGGTVTLARTGDALIIGDYSSGTYEISGGSFTAASTGANAVLGNRGGAGTLTVSGSGSVGIGGSMTLAPNGSATINLLGGTLAVNGMSRTGSGTFNFSGGTLSPYSVDTTILSSVAINLSGTGATLSGIDLATATPRLLTISGTLQGPGAITVAGGTVSLIRGNTHSGTTTASQGTLAIGNVNAVQNSTLNVGSLVTFTVAGTNTYNLGGLAGGTNLDVGPNTLSIGGNNGSTTYSGVLSGSTGVGFTKVGTGTLTLSGSSLLSGALTIRGGEIRLASGATLPSLSGGTIGAASGTATLRVQSGASLSTTGAVNIGSGSTNAFGAVIQEAGVVIVGANFQLSADGSATTYSGSASYAMQGGSLALNNTTSGFLSIGRNAPATFMQSGGTVTIARTDDVLTIGDYSTGSYEMSGGTLTAASGNARAVLGNRGGAGTLTITNSGSFGIGGSMFLAVNALDSASGKGSATINLQGGDLAVNGMMLGRVGVTGSNGPGTATFNFSGGTLRPYSANTSIGSATAANNFSITLSGTGATLSGIDRATSASRTLNVYANLQGTGDVTISSGLVNLRGTNTFSGLASIAAGGTAALLGTADSVSGFRVNGRLDLSSKSSGFTFGSGQTVSGAGAIVMPTTGPGVSLAGFLAPGNSPGTLAFTGAGTLDVTQAIDTESSQLLFELGSIGTSDLVTIASGTLDIGSGLLEFSDFAFTAIDGFSQGTYTLFSANAITGSLGSATTGAIGSYTGTLELSGNQIQLVVVPEPGAVTLAGLGFAAAVWTIYRRRAGRAP